LHATKHRAFTRDEIVDLVPFTRLERRHPYAIGVEPRDAHDCREATLKLIRRALES